MTPSVTRLGAIAEFERERIGERVLAGLERAAGQPKRPGRPKARLPVERAESVEGLIVGRFTLFDKPGDDPRLIVFIRLIVLAGRGENRDGLRGTEH